MRETPAGLISVIVPVYNVEPYLRRCLDSVLGGAYPELEVVCVNDGSADGSLAILREYEARDGRVLVVDQENRGLSAARNAGLERARGAYIAFVDSDDWVHPRYFQDLMEGRRRSGADIVLCEARVTGGDAPDEHYPDPPPVREISLAELEKRPLEKDRAWGKLYTRSVIGGRRFQTGAEPVEDMLFNLAFRRGDVRFALVERPLYRYFMRPDSAVHSQEGRSRLKTVCFLLEGIAEEKDAAMRRRRVAQAHKIVFSCRYLEMFAPDYAAIRAQCAAYLARLRPLRRDLALKERVLFGALARCPWLYRLWRIHDDPTLLQWERSKKAHS